MGVQTPMARNAPGYAFTFGLQPGDNLIHGMNPAARSAWLNKAAANNWISRDTLLNQPFSQSNSNRFDATASLEPWTDLKIDVTLFRAFSDNYSELYKFIDTGFAANGAPLGNYQHLNPIDAGSYTVFRICRLKRCSAKYHQQGIQPYIIILSITGLLFRNAWERQTPIVPHIQPIITRVIRFIPQGSQMVTGRFRRMY